MVKRLSAILTSFFVMFFGPTVAFADLASRDQAYSESGSGGGGFVLPVIVVVVALAAVLAARFIIGSRRK